VALPADFVAFAVGRLLGQTLCLGSGSTLSRTQPEQDQTKKAPLRDRRGAPCAVPLIAPAPRPSNIAVPNRPTFHDFDCGQVVYKWAFELGRGFCASSLSHEWPSVRGRCHAAFDSPAPSFAARLA